MDAVAQLVHEVDEVRLEGGGKRARARDVDPAVEHDAAGPAAQRAETVKTARFRPEAYAAYLDAQRRTLESAAERITGELLARIGTTTTWRTDGCPTTTC